MKRLAFVLVLLILFGVAYSLEKGFQTGKNGKNWEIKVDGLVANPYTIKYSQLQEMPSVNVSTELYCVDNPSTPLKKGTWTGVPLKYIIDKARPLKNATKIVFLASDGYTTDLWLGDINDTSIILAYEFNGKNITPRLVVPGRWGYKWIKGVVEIRLVDYNYLGTWERVGYSDSALINESRTGRPMK